MRIKAIVPVLTHAYDQMLKETIDAIREPDTEVVLERVQGGVESIENYYDEQMAIGHILRCAETAEREGFDVVTILCAGDPGVEGAKDVLTIPVVGIYEAALHLACLLGRRFAVVTVLPDAVPLLEDRITLLGLTARCASVRSVDIPVLELEKDPDRMMDALLEQSRQAIVQERADTMVLGCAGMLGVARTLGEKLRVPVIDPVVAGIKMCEVLHKLNLAQSRKAYFFPRKKKRLAAI